jgi:hypothetical protein
MSFIIGWLSKLARDSSGQPQFLNKLSDAIEGLTTRMVELRQQGERDATGKIVVEFSMVLEGDKVFTSAKISPKYSALKLPDSLSYVGEDGALYDEDPKQFKLKFDGATGKVEIKAPAKAAEKQAGSGKSPEVKGQDK